MRTTPPQPNAQPSGFLPLASPKPRQPNVSHFDTLPNAALISIKALAAVNGQGVSTLWRHCKQDPDFPKPIRLSPGCTRFNVGDIRAYLAKKAKLPVKSKPALRHTTQGVA